MVEHFVEAAVKGLDQRRIVGILGLQPTGGFGRIAAVVLHRVPRGRGHGSQEALHLRRLRDQLPVEMARVPVEKDAPHVENRHGRGRQT